MDWSEVSADLYAVGRAGRKVNADCCGASHVLNSACVFSEELTKRLDTEVESIGLWCH